MTYPSVHSAVREIFVEWYEKFSKFTPHQGEDVSTREWIPSYLPAGFSSFETYKTVDLTHIRYRNQEGHIVDFSYAPTVSSSYSVNNEEVAYRQVREEGILYHIFISTNADTMSSIIWKNSGYRFDLRGNMSEKELMQIAFSVK